MRSVLVPGGGHLPSPPLHCDSALCPDRHAQLSGLEAHRTLDLGGGADRVDGHRAHAREANAC